MKLFKWNDLKIYLECENCNFLSDIKNYFLLKEIFFSKKDSDIVFSIYNSGQQMFPGLKKNNCLVRTIDFFLEKNFELKIYAHEWELWYFYEDLARVWIDFKQNKIILSLGNRLFNFSYYNVLFFFFYPLSQLLENFDFYKLHSSCIDIDGKAVLFTGDSGSGKSTSAFALAAGGRNIISDDLTFVKKEGYSFYTYPMNCLTKLHENTLIDFFPQFLKYELLKSENGDIYINVKDINKNINEKADLAAIIILQRSGNKKSSFYKVHPLKVIPHLFPSSISTNIEKLTKRKFNFLTDLLDNVPCYNVNFGIDMDDFHMNIIKILNKEI